VGHPVEKDHRRTAEMTDVAYSRNTSEDGGQGVWKPPQWDCQTCVCVRAKAQVLTLKHGIK